MFDNSNPYSLHFEERNGRKIYFVSFTDGQDIERSVEVSCSVYEAFLTFIRHERNLRRSDERHLDKFELTDELIYWRALHKPKSLEDSAYDKQKYKQICKTIQQLPEIQSRRFLLSREYGLTYEQIAQIEGCSKVAVKYAIDKAKMAISKKFSYVD